MSDASTAVRRPLRVGIIALLVALAAGIAWAVMAPLDEGVPTSGMVMVDTKRKAVQHLSGGIVEKVLVREAQQVKAGEGLIKLNETTARAAYEAARQRYLGMRATQNRLQAEQQEAAAPVFHADVVAARDDPVIREHVRTEEQLFTSRRQALRSELAAMDETIRAQGDLAAGLAEQAGARGLQLASIAEERDGLRGLVAEGYAPRNKLLELDRNHAEVSAALIELRSNRAKALSSKSELTLRRLQRVQDYRKEVTTQLAEIQREVVADDEKLKASREDLERTLIRAPATGAVVGIASQTVGGVIPPGAKIMDIVPADEQTVLETQVPPHLIDRVHAGQSADIRFSGFPDAPQLVVEGRLISVSADVLSEPPNNVPYYLARVEITPKGRTQLGNHRLQPGMPAEVIVKTGERSLLTYLLSPLTRRLARSMKES